MTSKNPKYTLVTENQVQTPSLQPLQQRYRKQENYSYWKPFWLKLSFLVPFCFTLLCLIPALLILRHYADAVNEFGLITSNHYIWTYGPTTVLVIFISLWRLIDYHCKTLLPWAELAGGPAEAEKNILLDYISPTFLDSLVRAGKHRHYVVVLTILGSVLFKMTLLASTALFYPFTVTLGPSNVTMVQSTRFDNITNFTTYEDPGASSFYKAYVFVMKNYSLPEGVTSNLAYESIRPVDDLVSANAIYTASTGAFIPQVECDFVDIELEIDLSQYTDVMVEVPLPLKILNDSKWTCPDNFIDEIKVTSLPVAAEYLPPRQIISSFGSQQCTLSAGLSKGASSPILVALSDMHYNQTFNVSLANHTYGDFLRPTSWNFTIPSIRGLLCQTSYQLGSVQVSYNMLGAEPVIEVGESFTMAQSLENFSNISLANLLSYAIPTTVGGGKNIFGLLSDDKYAEQPPETIMELVAARAGSDYIYLLNNPDKMLEATEDILTTIMVFIANDLLLLQTNSTFDSNPVRGKKQYTTQKLKIQPESLYLIIGGISIVLFISLAIIFLRPRLVATTNLATLAAIAQVVRDNDDIQRQISQISALEDELGREALSHYKYFTKSFGRYVSLYRLPIMESNPIQRASYPVQKFYAPISVQKWLIIFTLSLAPTLILLLEVLQRISDNLDGIIFLEGESSLVVSIYTGYLPALILLLVAGLFNLFHFNTSVLAPFNRMYANLSCSQTLTLPLVGQFPLMALYNAYRNRYWGAYLTGIATILGSILTVVVSGLYSTEHVQRPTKMTLYGMDSFNLSFHQGTRTDNATAVISSLIESGMMSYPQFTYNELVFPSLSMSGSGSQSGTVTAQVPALQADLNCTDISYKDLNFTIAYVSHYGDTMLNIDGVIPLPANCQIESSNGNLTDVNYSYGPYSLDPISNTSYLGKFVDLHLWPYDLTQGIGSGKIDLSQHDNHPECASLLLIYGYFDGNNQTNSIMTAKRCDQILKKVEASVTFNLPAMTFASESPPVATESLSRYILSEKGNTRTFSWRLERFMNLSFQVLNTTTPSTITGFFDGVLNGKTPLPIHALAAGSPVTTHTPEEMFSHILSFYRRYMAQYISANIRNSTSNSNTNSSLIETTSIQGSFVSTSGPSCMVQNRNMKLVLQITLAAMFICCILAYNNFNRYHNIVPWNPCTIAGVMVLFAGSKMCSSGFSEARIREAATSRVSEDGLEMIHLTADDLGQDFVSDSTEALTTLSETEMVDPSLPLAQDILTIDKKRYDLSGGNFRLGWWRGYKYIGATRPYTKRRPELRFIEEDRRNISNYQEELNNNTQGYEALRYGIDRVLHYHPAFSYHYAPPGIHVSHIQNGRARSVARATFQWQNILAKHPRWAPPSYYSDLA